MEKDDEVKGVTGSSYDFGARMYDSRIGRWMSVDPQANKQPGWSPYKAFLDNPIIYEDPDGETEYLTVVVINEKTGETVLNLPNMKISDKLKGSGVRWVGGNNDNSNQQKWNDIHHIQVYSQAEDGSITLKTVATDYVHKLTTYAPFETSQWLAESIQDIDFGGPYGVPVWGGEDGYGVLMGEGKLLPGGKSYDGPPAAFGTTSGGAFKGIVGLLEAVQGILSLYESATDAREVVDGYKQAVTIPKEYCPNCSSPADNQYNPPHGTDTVKTENGEVVSDTSED